MSPIRRRITDALPMRHSRTVMAAKGRLCVVLRLPQGARVNMMASDR